MIFFGETTLFSYICCSEKRSIMKNLWLLSALVFTLSCSDSEKKDEEKEDTQEETSQSQTDQKTDYLANEEAALTINGMSCEINCVSSVKKALNKMDGVTEVTIDFDSEREGDFCSVKYDKNLLNVQSIQSVIESINDGAYKVTESSVKEIENDKPQSKSTAYMFSSHSSSRKISTGTSSSSFDIPSILDFVVAIF